MSNHYPELEAVLGAADELRRCRAAVSVSKEQGTTDGDLELLRRASRSAMIGLEKAAVDLVASDTLHARLEAAMTEAERRGMR